jgi:PPK2 family polyphosphate:nucleotide phosphotransferase
MNEVWQSYRASFEGGFSVDQASTRPPEGAEAGKLAKKALAAEIRRFSDLQKRLYASDRHSLLLVFQAMDAAGKDSTIRAVTTGVNPAGFQITSFKAPSKAELDHDFLWRTTLALPQRGRIGIFNRSHYEETLVVRVHPEYLEGQRLPPRGPTFWEERFESIRSHEAHLARNGTVVLKFWLNVSRKEQLRRFARRLDSPEKNWKFSAGDLDESERWHEYMAAYESMINCTSRPAAPWYAIPADDKPYMRLTVIRTICDALEKLELDYPRLSAEEQARIPEHQARIREALSALEG